MRLSQDITPNPAGGISFDVVYMPHYLSNVREVGIWNCVCPGASDGSGSLFVEIFPKSTENLDCLYSYITFLHQGLLLISGSQSHIPLFPATMCVLSSDADCNMGLHHTYVIVSLDCVSPIAALTQ